MWASLLLASVLVATAFASCPSGYRYEDSSDVCLKAFRESKSFFDARKICQDDGGDLVKTRDDHMADMVGFLLRLKYHWTGVWDEDGDNTFTYVDGSDLESYQPWIGGAPGQSTTGQSCVQAVVSHSVVGWEPIDCSTPRSFVCEI